MKYNEEENLDSKFIIIVLGFEEIESHLNEMNKDEKIVSTVSDLVLLSQKNKNFEFVLYNNANSCNEIKNGEISNIIDLAYGIWVGRGIESQNVFDTSNSYSDNVKVTSDMIVLVNNSSCQYLKIPKSVQ